MSLIEKIADSLKAEDRNLLALLDLQKSDQEILESIIDAKLLNFENELNDEDKEIQ